MIGPTPGTANSSEKFLPSSKHLPFFKTAFTTLAVSLFAMKAPPSAQATLPAGDLPATLQTQLPAAPAPAEVTVSIRVFE